MKMRIQPVWRLIWLLTQGGMTGFSLPLFAADASNKDFSDFLKETA